MNTPPNDNTFGISLEDILPEGITLKGEDEDEGKDVHHGSDTCLDSINCICNLGQIVSALSSGSGSCLPVVGHMTIAATAMAALPFVIVGGVVVLGGLGAYGIYKYAKAKKAKKQQEDKNLD